MGDQHFRRYYTLVLLALYLILLQKASVSALMCFCNGPGGWECQQHTDANTLPYCNGTDCFVRTLVASNGDIAVDYFCLTPILGHSHNEEVCKNQAFSCCNDKPFCNQYLPIPLLDISSTIFIVPSTSVTVTITPSTNSSSDFNQSTIIIPSIVVPVSLFSSLVAIIAFLIYKRNKRSQSKHNSSENGFYDKKGPDGLAVDSSYGFMQIIDPTPISITDITLSCTSGSGGGDPHMVKRTIARGTVLDADMIGGGRFGQVYLGYYKSEKYAVKKFFSRDEGSWFREKEIYNNFNMRHDNILTYVAADITSNNGVTELWLITQFHPRGSLFDELHRDPLTIEQVFKYIFSACRGLSYLHMEFPGAQGKPAIAHRDLKSKNLLVKNDDTLCIADFGLAIVQNNSALRNPENLRQGTKRYMAPELLEEKVDPDKFLSFIRTDIYSFGMVMWEICRRGTSGEGTAEDYELPFEYKVPPDPSFDDMREAVVLKGLTPDIPNRWIDDELLRYLSNMMKECWKKNPLARPTSFNIKKKLDKAPVECNLKISINY